MIESSVMTVSYLQLRDNPVRCSVLILKKRRNRNITHTNNNNNIESLISGVEDNTQITVHNLNNENVEQLEEFRGIVEVVVEVVVEQEGNFVNLGNNLGEVIRSFDTNQRLLAGNTRLYEVFIRRLYESEIFSNNLNTNLVDNMRQFSEGAIAHPWARNAVLGGVGLVGLWLIYKAIWGLENNREDSISRTVSRVVARNPLITHSLTSGVILGGMFSIVRVIFRRG